MLKSSIGHLGGPDLNQPGNALIIGHNPTTLGGSSSNGIGVVSGGNGIISNGIGFGIGGSSIIRGCSCGNIISSSIGVGSGDTSSFSSDGIVCGSGGNIVSTASSDGCTGTISVMRLYGRRRNRKRVLKYKIP